jgi:UDP-2,3-diacylglucosamine pyrophosphatase LpxH
LRKLNQSGTAVYYLLGNHDYWVRDLVKSHPSLFHLASEDAASDGILDRADQTIELEGKKVYIAHGDEIDRSLLTTLSRTILRSQHSPLVYFLLHPKLGLAYSRWFEKIARNLAGSMGITAKFEEFAAQKIKQGYDIVVLGHVHKPSFLPIESGFYLNTGNWIDNYSYVVIEDSRPRLEKFIE